MRRLVHSKATLDYHVLCSLLVIHNVQGCPDHGLQDSEEWHINVVKISSFCPLTSGHITSRVTLAAGCWIAG